MTPGVVAHLWFGPKVLLILRDKARPGERFADPNCWDSISETPEPEDGGDFQATMRRGLLEEIGILPAHCMPLGLTRQRRNGFFVGFLRKDEVASIVLGIEGQKWGLFTLEKARNLPLGGGIRHHLDAYPQAFKKMALGIVPTREELGLHEFEIPVPVAK